MDESYVLTPLYKEIEITHIVSIHYFEFVKNYVFEGESHNFWELVYCDKGEVNIYADQHMITLKKGEMVFHKPNEWHTVIANGVIAPNLIIVAFHCESDAMEFFEHKLISVDNEIKDHLSIILKEGINTYSNDVKDSTYKKLIKKDKIPFGSEQLIQSHLELMLLGIIRKGNHREKRADISTSVKLTSDEIKLQSVLEYLNSNLEHNITIYDIQIRTGLSKSSLQKLFRRYMNISVMEYYSQLRIEKAKIMIREGHYNFSQIAYLMGFTSIHYFSRIFKKNTGMTITEYAMSVKAIVDKKSVA